MTTLVIIFICSYLAFSLSAICGGGAGLILMPILGGLLPIGQVPAALSIGTFTSSASRIIIFYKSISWQVVKFFVPAAIPAVWLGAWLLKFINPLYLEIIMGLFLISNLPFVFRKPKEVNFSGKRSNSLLMVIGFLAGLLSGLTGAVGLLFNKFYLRHGLSKDQIIATRAANEIILHLIKIVLYILFGLITTKVMTIGLVVAASAVLSSITMKWILPRLSENIFKKIGYLAMVISGVVMLTQSGQSVLLANEGAISSKFIAKGVETRLQWQNANYALEFAYDEGFEFELVIGLADLSDTQQQFVLSQKGDASRIIIEEVYTLNTKYYEAYFFRGNVLRDKIDFD
ncbi:MAG: sulfite exporter TauE/SafE family protein [Cytophagales bacterium]|nr:sulfite exporter TauE/SafE family protein [Cytophagales bacterium]MCA6368836.1 sulfite exporter TauE/SafE family protein [Cytophagales bacterium]MCA6373168.1 sulfite exporter TauE/SafE family protein [Cytophagales bacterium]MCA6377290.1 sulfite exporter TauE/SafE family protein [Cytophagales bacterium]MCA6383067.1 sulfite exporter TauE/SafE family protein [Cytophagales bacterium]